VVVAGEQMHQELLQLAVMAVVAAVDSRDIQELLLAH
jgi:hypothetical protein